MVCFMNLPREMFMEIISYFDHLSPDGILNFYSLWRSYPNVGAILKELFRMYYILIHKEKNTCMIRPRIGHILLDYQYGKYICPVDNKVRIVPYVHTISLKKKILNYSSFFYSDQKKCLIETESKMNGMFRHNFSCWLLYVDEIRKDGHEYEISIGDYNKKIENKNQCYSIDILILREQLDLAENYDITRMYYFFEDKSLSIIHNNKRMVCTDIQEIDY